MAQPKPLASLSSGLLARPGMAKPAMRPQLFGQPYTDDLGWNDMGHSAPAQAAPVQAPPAPVVPVQVVATQPAPATDTRTEATPVPPVLAERAKLAGAVARAKSRTKPVGAKETRGRKAAFTLRLDANRHLRLRLASAVDGRSSQQLVVEALDAFLSAQPEVEALARQIPATQRHSGGK